MFASDTPSAIITAVGGLVLAVATFLGALRVATRRQNGKVDQAKSAAAQARMWTDWESARLDHRIDMLFDALEDERGRRRVAEEAAERWKRESQELRRGRGGTGRSRS